MGIYFSRATQQPTLMKSPAIGADFMKPRQVLTKKSVTRQILTDSNKNLIKSHFLRRGCEGDPSKPLSVTASSDGDTIRVEYMVTRDDELQPWYILFSRTDYNSFVWEDTGHVGICLEAD
jgi:hypothetical protein